MNSLARRTSSCFRAELLEVLQGPRRRQRRSLGHWLLDFVFSSRSHVEHAGACCDHCQPELTKRIRAGTYTPGDRLTRRLSINWRRLLASSLTALLVIAIALTALDHEHKEASTVERTTAAYETYVAH